MLAEANWQGERLAETDGGGNDGVDELVERIVAQCLQHRGDLGGPRADVTADEATRIDRESGGKSGGGHEILERSAEPALCLRKGEVPQPGALVEVTGRIGPRDMDELTTKASLRVKQMPSSLLRPAAAPRWRLLRTPPLDGATNMALDAALVHRAASTGEWVLRTYSWSSPTLSLGRNQQARGRYDVERLGASEISVVRRPTGGRAILHDREVTYSVTAPLEAAGSLRHSYIRINRLLVFGLESLGVRVELAGRAEPTPPPGVSPCFALPSAGELVHAGRKLAGSAQWRDEQALLQHGSILLEGDQALVSALLLEPVAPPPLPATLRGALGRLPSVSEVAESLEAAVRELEDADAEPLVWEGELQAAAAAQRPAFEDPAWTWRR